MNLVNPPHFTISLMSRALSIELIFLIKRKERDYKTSKSWMALNSIENIDIHTCLDWMNLHG